MNSGGRLAAEGDAGAVPFSPADVTFLRLPQGLTTDAQEVVSQKEFPGGASVVLQGPNAGHGDLFLALVAGAPEDRADDLCHGALSDFCDEAGPPHGIGAARRN